MTRREIKNVAASVHQRLLDQARKQNRPFQTVLQHYALERWLYPLSESSQVDRFVLKGALMLLVWRAPVVRHTLDIDLLGRIDNDPVVLDGIVRDVCGVSAPDDGMVFDRESVRAEPITADAEYVGVRATFRGALGRARVAMQIDVGIGDAVVGAERIEDYPVLLDFPGPRLLGTSRETSIAEKFHAMIQRGRLNSRIKDYFDIWLLSRHFEFDGAKLADAIRRTMETRRTVIPARPEGLDPEYARSPGRASQWRKFIERNRVEDDVPPLEEVVAAIAAFLLPVSDAVREQAPFTRRWPASGPWSE